MCEVNASKSDQTPLKAWWDQLTWTNSSGELKPWIKYIAVYHTYIEVYMLNEDFNLRWYGTSVHIYVDKST